MKYSDLPYIRLNGGQIVEDDSGAWSSNKTKGLRKQASVSCEVLTWEDDFTMPSSASSTTHPYVNIPPNRALPDIPCSSNDDSYVCLGEVAPRANRSLTVGKDDHLVSSPVTSNSGEGMTAVVFREIARKRQAGLPSQVFEVCYDYTPTNQDEIELKSGTTVTLITEKTGENLWYYGKNRDGNLGFFPATHVRLIGDEASEIKSSQISLPPGVSTIDNTVIGRGAYADVHSVYYNNKNVALKRLRKVAISQKDEAALRQEAVMINRLKHPNIVQLYGICLEKPYCGLVLELCLGKSLKTMLRSFARSFTSVRVLVDFAAQIADAMAYLAQHNCVHRDLKADNVLVKEEVCLCWLDGSADCHTVAGTPTTPSSMVRSISQDITLCPKCKKSPIDRLTLKVTDFGLTRQLSEDDEANRRYSKRVVGTPAWMAPEAYMHQKYSEFSDVWSYGVVLWEILMKEEPYEDKSNMLVAFLVARDGPSLKVDDNCPLRWNEIMKSCWEKDPTKRPTFAELLRDFKEYQEQLQADGVTLEEERRVQEAQQEINNIVDNIHKQNPQTNINKLFEQLYHTMEGASKLMSGSDKPDKQPTRRQKNRKNRIRKEEIGTPGDMHHILSVRPTSCSPHGGSHFNIILADSTDSAPPVMFGTLPRTEKEREAAATRHALENNLSISSPNLNQLEPDKKGTLVRKDAIKRKRPTVVPSSACSNENALPVVQLAHDADALDTLATPRRTTAVGTIGSSSRKSEGGEKEKKEKFISITRIFGRKQRQQSSVDESADESSPMPNSSRSSFSSAATTPASSNRFAVMPQFGRAPVMSPHRFDKPAPRPRAHSSTSGVTSEDEGIMSPSRLRNKISPVEKAKKAIVQTTNQTSTYSASRSQFSLSAHREIGIDETIPSPSETSNNEEFPPSTYHRRTTSDDRAGLNSYEVLRNNPNLSPPSRRAPLQPKLSTVVPLPSLPVDSSPEDPYIQCAPLVPPSVNNPSHSTARTINNLPYVQMPQAPPTSSSITNSHYFQCVAKPERPDSLPLRRANTPESSGISTGGSSAFSTMSSLTDQVPLSQAPPPPRPPAIPPREGHFALPV